MFFPCLMPHELDHLAKLIDRKTPDIPEQDLRRSILTNNLYHNVRMGLLQIKSSQRTKKALLLNNKRESSENRAPPANRVCEDIFGSFSDSDSASDSDSTSDSDSDHGYRSDSPDSERTERGDLRRGVLTEELKNRVRIGIRQAHRGQPITEIRAKQIKKRKMIEEGALPASAELPKVKKSFPKNDVREEEPPTKKKKYIHSSSSSKGSLISDTLSNNHRLDSITSHDNDYNRSGDFAVPNAHINTKTDGPAKKKRK